MPATSTSTVALADGRTIPQLGLGVYKVPDDEAERVVDVALEAGYRHLDTASFYGNERGVGAALRSSGLPRDEVFVTTKVWYDDHGRDATLRSFDRSLELLGVDEVDLYLIHWPAPAQDRYVETWRALLDARLRRVSRCRRGASPSAGPSRARRSRRGRRRSARSRTRRRSSGCARASPTWG